MLLTPLTIINKIQILYSHPGIILNISSCLLFLSLIESFYIIILDLMSSTNPMRQKKRYEEVKWFCPGQHFIRGHWDLELQSSIILKCPVPQMSKLQGQVIPSSSFLFCALCLLSSCTADIQTPCS